PARPDAAAPSGTAGLDALADAALPDAAPSAAQTDAALQGSGQARAQVALGLTGVTPTVHEKITIAGVSQNRSGHQLAGLTLRLRYNTKPVTSRSQLDQFAAGQPSGLHGAGAPKPLAQAAAPGAKQTWKIDTTVRALGLQPPVGTPGVYPVGVEVLNSAQQVVGGVVTFLTLVPKQATFKPVQIGWVYPLIDRQHRAGDRTFLDDQLSKDMAAGGRLSELVSAAEKTRTPITWGIDPALLDDVQRMAADDYTVKAPGARTGSKKPKSTAAAAWLASLKRASQSDPYFTVPYADPDVVPLVRYKMSKAVTIANDARNTNLVSQFLQRPATDHIAYPPDGLAGPGTLDLLAKLELKSGGSFLLNSRQFQEPAQGSPANALTAVNTPTQGTKKALVYDDKLSQIVSGGSVSGAGALLTQQRFLAETAVIAGETPSFQRTVVVAPDRHWNPAPGLATTLLKYTRGASWLRTAELGKIGAARPQARTFNGYSEDYEASELGYAYLRQVQVIAGRAASFEAVLVEPVKISYERALLRVQSAAWRPGGLRAKRARVALADELDAQMGDVRIITVNSRRINMAGRSGKFPVTVANRLRDQSIRVRLTARSENSAKLQLGRLDTDQEIIELGPGQNAQRWIPAQAAGNGNFGVHLQLEIADSSGRPFGKGTDITVRTTGYGRLALLITGGGLAVLFVGVGVRAIRARRRRKAEAAGDGSTGMGPAATGGAGNGFPGPGYAGPGAPDAASAGAGEPWAGAGAPGPGTAGFGPAVPGTAGPAGPAGPAASGTAAAGPGTAGSVGTAGAETAGSGAAGSAGPAAGLPAGVSGAGPAAGSAAGSAAGAGVSGPGLPGAAGPAPAGPGLPGAGLPGPGPAAGSTGAPEPPGPSASDGQAPGRSGKHRGGNSD
ncbi:DUF6049 family protein, partial [Actinomadura fibrosa]